jgi:hypothetical protein
MPALVEQTPGRGYFQVVAAVPELGDAGIIEPCLPSPGRLTSFSRYKE